MKLAWSVLLLFACACAAPKRFKSEGEIKPSPSAPSAFHVTVTDVEPETRRYRLKAEELAEGTDYGLKMNGADEGHAGPLPLMGDAATAARCQAARLVRDFVAPGTWNEDPRRAVYVDKDEIVIRHAPVVLESAERLFDVLKANRDVLVSLKARFVSMRREELEIIEHLPMISGGLGGVVETQSLEALGLAGRGRTLVMPKLTLFHGQMGRVRIASDFAFIAGYEKVGEGVYDPKPSVTWAGYELAARGVVNGLGSDRWLLDLALTSRDLPGIPSCSFVRLANRIYEMPTAVESRASSQFVVGPGQSILILAPEAKARWGIAGQLAGEAAHEEARVTLIIVEAARIDPSK
ncbi:MAG TPA: hypothetical protein VJU16_03920 [Planctomycetota bacterium]|nr:hypothetical protein [Planctomycetota bacterium]